MTRWMTLTILAAALAVTQAPAPASAQGLLNQFRRDIEEARRDLRQKMGVNIRVEPHKPARRAAAPRGPVITRQSGLVATSIRPEMRPGAAPARSGGPSEAELRQERLLAEAVEAGVLAPETAQAIRAGTFPTRSALEARAEGLGSGALPDGAGMALRGDRVICEDGGAGGCALVADDPEFEEVRLEAEAIAAQAEAVRVVAGLPRLAAAMAEVARERARTAGADGAARQYPVARGAVLPSIDSLLDARNN